MYSYVVWQNYLRSSSRIRQARAVSISAATRVFWVASTSTKFNELVPTNYSYASANYNKDTEQEVDKIAFSVLAKL